MTVYRNRGAVQIENETLRLTVLVEGGHIAELLHKPTGINPLWTPPWPSIEPSSYDPARHPEYGLNAESKLLAGLMGHNLCMDIFGGPSEEEAAAGMTVHGEASVARYDITVASSATKSKVIESDFTGGKGYMKIGAEFDWPQVPNIKGGTTDMRVFVDLPVSGAFSTHLMDPQREEAFFLAWSPKSKLLFGYVWKRTDFPWLGIWEENHCRTAPPWNGHTTTRGMEFGVSPMPETRRQMIQRGSLFGVPGYRWIPARKTVHVEYRAFLTTAPNIPDQPPF